jgi:hypothetical protein
MREARAPAIRAELGEIVEATPAARSAVAAVTNRELGSTGAARKGQGGWLARDCWEDWDNGERTEGKRREARRVC